MNKCILFFSLTMFPISLFSMNIAIPVAHNNEVTVFSDQKRPVTPRSPIATHDTPARRAYIFAEAVNCGNYNQAMDMASEVKELSSYGPAFVLKEIFSGEITPNSPFFSKDAWEKFNFSTIDKKQFLNCAIYSASLLERFHQYNNRGDKAEKCFMITRHLYQLSFSEKEFWNNRFISALKSKNYNDALMIMYESTEVSDNQVVTILKHVIDLKISDESPFKNKDNWRLFQGACGLSKFDILSIALYAIERKKLYHLSRKSNTQLDSARRERAERLFLKYKKVEKHLHLLSFIS